MIGFGSLIIPSDIVAALAASDDKSGWLGGASLQSEDVFLVTFARIGLETTVCQYYASLFPHRSFDVFEGIPTDELLQWARVKPGFLDKYPPYEWFDTTELASETAIEPNKFGELTKHICVIEPGDKGPKVKAFMIASKASMSKFLRMDVTIVPPESDPFVRIPKELTAALHKKRVTIVGLGSGGGEIALNLACAGVGNLVLFDGDRLRPENYVRHTLTKRDLGRTKVAGIADALRERTLPTAVVSHGRDVLFWANEFRDSLVASRPDLLICATDSRDSRRFINICAVRLNIPLVLAAILDAGRIGEVILVRPHETACYECIRLSLGGTMEVPESGDRSTTPYLGGEENDLQTAVQRFDIGFVSSIATRVALQVLDSDRYQRLPADYLVWGRERLQEYANPFTFEYPLSLNFVRVHKHSDCPACGANSLDLHGVDTDGTFAEIIAELDRLST
jgi:hypothetical protein